MYVSQPQNKERIKSLVIMYTLVAATFPYRSVHNTYRGVWFVNYHKVSASMRYGNSPPTLSNM